ncbi:MAG: SMC-Scp complex subunit ScpB [Alphaproteobacteria bacterium]|nr:SMC-Scp complex subunit ScpB [Alphaproteobacteria bacterium]
MSEDHEHLRLIEAILFAAAEPVDARTIASRLPEGTDVDALMRELESLYANRGVNVLRRDGRWAIRTAPDLAPLLRTETVVSRKLSRAAVEILAIIAYHQPVTRAEIEEIRGVQISRGTLDTLLESGWVRPGRRRRTPGRPVTWVTTTGFLDHFGLEGLDDLPGIEELKGAGLLDSRPAIETVAGVSTGPDPDEHPSGADDIGEVDEFEDDFNQALGEES